MPSVYRNCDYLKKVPCNSTSQFSLCVDIYIYLFIILKIQLKFRVKKSTIWQKDYDAYEIKYMISFYKRAAKRSLMILVYWRQPLTQTSKSVFVGEGDPLLPLATKKKISIHINICHLSAVILPYFERIRKNLFRIDLIILAKTVTIFSGTSQIDI